MALFLYTIKKKIEFLINNYKNNTNFLSEPVKCPKIVSSQKSKKNQVCYGGCLLSF